MTIRFFTLFNTAHNLRLCSDVLLFNKNYNNYNFFSSYNLASYCNLLLSGTLLVCKFLCASLANTEQNNPFRNSSDAVVL